MTLIAPASSPSAILNRALGPAEPISPDRALATLIANDRPLGEGLAQWEAMSTADRARATSGDHGGVEFARAEIRDGRILVRPEGQIRTDLPTVDLPNNVAARGFSPGITSHDYLVPVLAPPTLTGPGGLAAVGRALVANPTPGRDLPSTSLGSLNDVGRLVPWDGGTNIVRSYVIPSSDPRRSDTVVNYTVQGEHAMSEGFVLRFAELRPDGRVELVTYGEGNATLQADSFRGGWGPIVDRTWTSNAREIFDAAIAGRQ